MLAVSLSFRLQTNMLIEIRQILSTQLFKQLLKLCLLSQVLHTVLICTYPDEHRLETQNVCCLVFYHLSVCYPLELIM